MTDRHVFCKKLNQLNPGLTEPPLPGALGEKIYHEISAAAWDMWLAHQTILINEYRLNLMDAKDRTFLKQQLQGFLGLE